MYNIRAELAVRCYAIELTFPIALSLWVVLFEGNVNGDDGDEGEEGIGTPGGILRFSLELVLQRKIPMESRVPVCPISYVGKRHGINES